MLGNYGIKRILPRLIVAAILVNLSYYVCQLAVDLSNVVGQTATSLFEAIPTGQNDISSAGANGWDDAIGFILAAGFGIGLLVAVLLAPSVLLVFLLIIFILVARQAAIILLIVISPLAFVAYLLPNTEQWFKKWLKMFTGLLLVFPIIAVVFGGATLASKVIGNVAGDDDQTLAIIALGIQAVPLFAVPLLLKGAMAATGSIGAKISGLANGAESRAKKSAGDGLKRHGESLESRMAARGGRIGAIGGFRKRRGFRRNSMESETERRQEESLAEHVLENPDRYNERQRALATSQFDKHYEESVKGASTRLQADMSHDAILAAAASGRDHNGRALNEHEHDAAIRYTMERGNFNERRAAVDGIGGMTRSQRKSLVSGLRSKGDAEVYGNQALAALEATDNHNPNGTGVDTATAQATLAAGLADKVNQGGLSPEALTKDHRVTNYVADVVTTPGSGVAAGARTTLSGDIATFAANNPQAWTRLDTQTRNQAGRI